MGTVTQITAIAAIRAKARAAVAWDLLPESKIRTDPQHLDSSVFSSELGPELVKMSLMLTVSQDIYGLLG